MMGGDTSGQVPSALRERAGDGPGPGRAEGPGRAQSEPPERVARVHSRSATRWNGHRLKAAGVAVIFVVALFTASGPLVRWVGRTAGIDSLPYRETAAFAYPSVADAGVVRGSHVRIAITVIRRSVVPWSATAGGFLEALGAVDVRPGRVSYVLVPVPDVRTRTWLTIHIGGLPAPLRVEVRP